MMLASSASAWRSMGTERASMPRPSGRRQPLAAQGDHERVSARQGPAAATASLPISVRGITKRYGAFTALDAVDLDIASGEFITLLGPSGSGKTTLLMVLAGFIRPDSGTLLFGDRDVSLVPPHKRNVGMVFQNYALFPHMSVLAMLPIR